MLKALGMPFRERVQQAVKKEADQN